MLKGNARHTGFAEGDTIRPPFKLLWARQIENERLGTAVEPILSDQKVLVPTHAGNVYALEADSGRGLWRFKTGGPILHSPAAASGVVVFGSTDASIYGVSTRKGELLWECEAGGHGVSASPVIEENVCFVGTRAGDFLALNLQGKVLWKKSLGVPIRQTAAVYGERVFVTGEDLAVRCFEKATGNLVWISRQLPGQTARDYYPVVADAHGRAFVIVRTNPILNMGQRIALDRGLLCRNAGIDDRSWQNIDRWMKSESARGTPELWKKEQAAIGDYLSKEPDAQTFFAFEGETGKEMPPPPVLWIAGCQGVGAMPAVASDGRLLVFYRSAYGNWNRGVAPLVALGLLDLAENRITPLFHNQGPQPPWNCFWGTADESQNFVIVGDTALIVHQGTLSGFNLHTNELFAIWGERDTYGGFRNPPWARNEWHGPARSGVAVLGSRIYWQTGSRILCVACGEAGAESSPLPESISIRTPTHDAQSGSAITRAEIKSRINKLAGSVLADRWAPLFTDPGLSGRVFAFQHTSELFEALAWAFPHLDAKLQAGAKQRLQTEWSTAPPFSPSGALPLAGGRRREWFIVRPQYCQPLGAHPQAHLFGFVYAAWLFGERCGEARMVLEAWPQFNAAFKDFQSSGWRLNPAKPDLFANRYLAALMSFHRLAEKAGESNIAAEASSMIESTSAGLVEWWARAAGQGTLRTFHTASELDPFIGRGDGLFFAVAPHRHKLALFQDLTPETASLVRAKAGDSARKLWHTFQSLCASWHLAGEERQVHFGENFIDAPDFALSAFRALAFLGPASFGELALRLDMPFCRADLYYLIKLALALEARD
jgi:hypothetical protein